MPKRSTGLAKKFREADEDERKLLIEGLPYRCGYMKAPVERQFKPGNRAGKGRPKGAKNIRTIIEEELMKKISVMDGGKTVEVPMARLLVRQIARKGAQGDTKAALAALELGRKHNVLSAPAQERAQPMFSSEDIEALKAFEVILGSSHPIDKEDGDEEP